jgi:hypothetical protein
MNRNAKDASVRSNFQNIDGVLSENNSDSAFSSASESASQKSSVIFLVCSCCFFPSYPKCLTNTFKCLILLTFDSYALRASGGEQVVRE